MLNKKYFFVIILIFLFSLSLVSANEFISPTPQDNEALSHNFIPVRINSTSMQEHYTFLDFNNSLVGWFQFEEANIVGSDIIGSYHSTDTFGIVFDTFGPVSFGSATVDSQSAGNMDVEVRAFEGIQAVGEVIYSNTFSVSAGVDTIDLNFTLPEEGRYILYRSNNHPVKRQSSGINFSEYSYSHIDFIGGCDSGDWYSIFDGYYYFFNIETWIGNLTTGNNFDYVSGKFGTAADFSESDAYINLGNENSLDLSNNLEGFTASLWFHPGASLSSDSALIQNTDTWSGGGWNVYLRTTPNQQLAFHIGGTTIRTGNINFNQWNHLVAWWNGSEMKLYHDGDEIGSTDRDTISSCSGRDTIIGIQSDVSNYSGLIDDILLFNRPLSEYEIKSLYDSGSNQYENNFTNLSEGEYSFKGYALNSDSNFASTETRTVIIASEEVPINFVNPTPEDKSTIYQNYTLIKIDSQINTQHYTFLNWDNSLMGWWRLENTSLTDESGKDNYGTNYGATLTSGKFGEGMSLQGIGNPGEYIRINKDLTGGLNAITVSGWAYSNNVDSAFLSSAGIIFHYGGAGFYLRGNDGGNSGYLSWNTKPIPGEWHHLVATWSSPEVGDGLMRIYINGEQQSSTRYYDGGENGALLSSSSLDMGRYFNSGQPAFNGTIDDIMIFNRALSEDEIKSLYNAKNTQYEANFTDLSQGHYLFKGYTVNVLGNKNSTETRNVTIASQGEIRYLEDLDNIRNDMSGDYILMRNLDFCDPDSYSSPYNGDIQLSNLCKDQGATVGWNPLGDNSNRFSGSFNGNGKLINNLFINRNDTNYVGLFGVLSSDLPGIFDLGLRNINITGNNRVGGLVGMHYSTVHRCFSTGIVNGNDVVGGLVGDNSGGLENSYSSAKVSGNDRVGGLVGLGWSWGIIRSHSFGQVIGNTNAGGLVGSLSMGWVSNSFYDNETSGQSDTGKGEPKSTSEMQDFNTFDGVDWNISLLENFIDEIWKIRDGVDYPRLGWEDLDIFQWEPPTPEDGEIIVQDTVGLNVTIFRSGHAFSWFDFDNSLKGYWSFDNYDSNYIYDDSSYSNVATYEEGLSSNDIISGKFGQAIIFDANNYLIVEDLGNSSLNMPDKISISAWIYDFGGGSSSQNMYGAPSDVGTDVIEDGRQVKKATVSDGEGYMGVWNVTGDENVNRGSSWIYPGPIKHYEYLDENQEVITVELWDRDTSVLLNSVTYMSDSFLSYPIPGSNWTQTISVRYDDLNSVNFTYQNLSIAPFGGTTWSDTTETEDLKFLNLKCGETEVDYEWIADSVFIENYTCNQNTVLTAKVINGGYHRLYSVHGEVINSYSMNTWISGRFYGSFREHFEVGSNYSYKIYYHGNTDIAIDNFGIDRYHQEVIQKPSSYRIYSRGIGNNLHVEWLIWHPDGTSTSRSYNIGANEFRKWHHLVFTYEKGGDMNIYINGNLEGSWDNNPKSIRFTDNNLRMGFRNLLALDEVQIHNRILSPQEVRALYNNSDYQLEANFDTPVDGVYKYTASAVTDSQTVETSSQRIFEVQKDTIAPVITWQDPTPHNGTVSQGGNIHLNAQVQDQSKTSAFFDFDSSLIGYWNADSFDVQGLIDESSNENNALFRGSLNVEDITKYGKFGKALSFKGYNNYLELPGSASTAGKSEFTIEFWVNPNKWFTSDTIWDEYYDPYWWQNTIRGGYWYTRDTFTGWSGSRTNDLRLPSLDEGSWAHLSFVYSVYQGIKAIYLNGNLYSYTTAEYPMNSYRTGIRIGYPTDGTFFSGKLDEIKLHNRALSSSEIKASYDNSIYSLQNNFENLDAGDYTYKAYAIDASGNLAIEEMLYIESEEETSEEKETSGPLEYYVIYSSRRLNIFKNIF